MKLEPCRQHHPLPHSQGGMIYRAFWLCAPICRADAARRQLFDDSMQELYVIAREHQHLRGRDLTNAVQRLSYEFWKKCGFRKVRTGCNVRWTIREKQLIEPDGSERDKYNDNENRKPLAS